MVELLRVAGDRIIVPSTVVAEVSRRDPEDPASRALDDNEWLTLVKDVPVPTRVRAFALDPGETAVIAWALAHPGTTAILDDLAARRHATVLAIPILGTLGIILKAKQSGIIAEAGPIVESARRAGLYLSDRVVRDALNLVGE
jgi:predicted nucleic acid-binding protein